MNLCEKANESPTRIARFCLKFLVFSPARKSWLFSEPFFFFSRDFRGSVRKTSLFFGWFSVPFFRRLFVTCCVFTRYFFVAFSWFFRGFFVALFCLEKQCSDLFRYFFVAPVLGKFYAYSPWNSFLCPFPKKKEKGRTGWLVTGAIILIKGFRAIKSPEGLARVSSSETS